jgi:multicomponent Na+:H+ antiporter subunit D
MGDDLAALQVILPLTAAPVCALISHRRTVHVLTLVVTAGTFAIAAALTAQVLDSGPFSYSLGGWSAPIGIEYRVDELTVFVLLIVSSVSALVMAHARESLEVEIPYDRYNLFHVMYLLSLAGLLGITVTGDLFNVFVFLEISALSGYVLISMGKDRRSLTAAYQYLIMGTIGATFILIGIGLMYMMTGTLNMADMAVRLRDVEQTNTVIAAFGFLTTGIAVKIALFPFHQWLPNAYTYAPSVVTCFMASTATKVAVYVLLRFSFTVYGPDFSLREIPLPTLLMPLALAAMFSASFVAIFQQNVKRILAYSSVAQIGYMVLGISLASVTGLTGGILHLANHAVMKAVLFCSMSAVFVRIGSTHIDDLRGLGKEMPFTFAAFTVGGLGLIGVPLTAGFTSKWYLVRGALENGSWFVAALILASSLLAVVYVWRILEVAYFEAPPPGRAPVSEAPFSMLLPLWVLVAGTIWLGVDTELTVGLAERAATSLLEGSTQLAHTLPLPGVKP